MRAMNMLGKAEEQVCEDVVVSQLVYIMLCTSGFVLRRQTIVGVQYIFLVH